MRNSKFDELQLNISVVGLSGSENVKGIQGVGKSCLCNRLVQPNFFKSKHVSIISSTDFYGSTYNQSHWIYWGSLNKEIREKKYNFHFIEQTILIDDSSFQEFVTNTEPHDFIRRASMTELRIKKNAYIYNQNSENDEKVSLNFENKLQIHLFLLIFDVSEVEKRNAKQQEVVFKQLFEAIVANKKPLIIVTTKNDSSSSAVCDILKAIIDKRPYNKYPILETSSKLDININPIYELAVFLCDTSHRGARQPITMTYSEAILAREKENKQLMKEFAKLIHVTLENNNMFLTWQEFIESSEIGAFRNRFIETDLFATFKTTQEDLLLKRRGSNNRRFKEVLLTILKKFDHLIPLDEIPIEDIMKNLRKDSAFMSHFTDFQNKVECFTFDQRHSDVNVIPLYLLDPDYENNLLCFIEKHAQRKCLEYKMYLHLVEDAQRLGRKSFREIREDLTKFINFFVPEEIIKHVYEKFQTYYLGNLRRQFFEIIHENPNIFWSQNVVKFLETISSHRHWTINGCIPIVTSGRQSNDRKGNDNLLTNKLIKDLNKFLLFDEVSMTQDDRNLREDWIREYLLFLCSNNDHECIIANVTHDQCSTTLISNLISNLVPPKRPEEIIVDSCHMFHIAILGNKPIQTSFETSIRSRCKDLPLKICKVHSIQYQVELIVDLQVLKETVHNLGASNDRCSIVCVVFLIDKIDEQESQIKDLEHFLSNQDSEVLLTKYIVCTFDYSINSADLHDNYLVELVDRKKYIFKHLLPDSHQQTIDWIVSTTQKVAEQNFIWIVTVCGDSYDHASVLTFLFECVKEFFLPFQLNLCDVTLTGSSNEIIIHKFHLRFMSYHQVIKLVLQSSSLPPVDAMIFICSLDRRASINTCLAIKKHLPDAITSSCHFLFMCIGNSLSLHSELFQLESLKQDIEYGFYETDHNEELKLKLFDFLKEIWSDSGTIDSLHSVTSDSSSRFIINSNKQSEGLIKYLNKTMCQNCSDSYRSDINVYVNSSLAKDQNKTSVESYSYDEVLGTANESAFLFWSPEFLFDGAQDVCNKCTKVNCSLHSRLDVLSSAPTTFRTRIRSQSGPDLRSPTDFTHHSLNLEMTLVCSVCEQDISKTAMDRQSFRLMRQNATKETTQKTFTTKLQNLFNPARKNSETQLVENRKWFGKSISKRHKS